jgi:hypothetical protein
MGAEKETRDAPVRRQEKRDAAVTQIHGGADVIPNPLTLQILLAIHVHPPEEARERIGVTTWGSHPGYAARRWLCDNGLINSVEADTTPKGRAFISSLLSAPLPVEQTRWVIPKPSTDRDFNAMYREWPE